MYLYLINEKSESLKMFKTFKAEVENQLDQKIKVVRSNMGVDMRMLVKHLDLSLNFVKDNENINQYTMTDLDRKETKLKIFEGVGLSDRSKTLQSSITKLDMKAISCFFIGYPESSKGYQFYAPLHNTRIVETKRAEFLENVNISRSGLSNDFDLQDSSEDVPIIQVLILVNASLGNSNKNVLPCENDFSNEETNVTLQMNLRKRLSLKHKKLNILHPKSFDDYITNLNETDLNSNKNDPFTDAITCDQSTNWNEAMIDELHSMKKNDVWELAELPKGYKPMTQLEGFISKGQEHLVCKLRKSIYGLKQTSRQWYLKFDEVMKKNDFVKNQVDQRIYLKLSRRNFIILVLYVDDILLVNNNVDLLHESKSLLLHHFDMKDLGETSYAYSKRVLSRHYIQHFNSMLPRPLLCLVDIPRDFLPSNQLSSPPYSVSLTYSSSNHVVPPNTDSNSMLLVSSSSMLLKSLLGTSTNIEFSSSTTRYPRPHWVQTNPRQFLGRSPTAKTCSPGSKPPEY
ncbi:LOW QUALITY PROTEIN: hypothetical protein OSB04_025318 [Centaurea solstitialis]|uniref:Reverse transcriptase Ty1/copia-type domain-containing protein n=1 Tax=Centaurea solstitialis TaxID=347529 RepID=A0AA38T195_9ASTR|nr:LOW QUALITY PROTEIN: hypothetical protein OSB04_025318 [Centaurea solstitialis]